MCCLRVSRLLQMLHPKFHLYCQPTDRPDQKGAAGENQMEPGSGDRIPDPQRGAFLISGPARTQFRPPLHPPDGCLQHGAGSHAFTKEGEEHPVVFISRKLCPAETTVEREALAIKWAVLQLLSIISWEEVSRYSRTTLLSNGWPGQRDQCPGHSGDFHFRLQHRARASHGNANRLSRMWSGWTGQSVNVTPLP